MPLDVICPGCGEVYFETNDKKGFNPHVTGGKSDQVQEYDPNCCVNAAMIRLKKEFIGTHIEDISHDSSNVGDSILCPQCEAPLCMGGLTITTRPQKLDPCICEICKLKFDTERAKKIHRTLAHGKKRDKR